MKRKTKNTVLAVFATLAVSATAIACGVNNVSAGAEGETESLFRMSGAGVRLAESVVEGTEDNSGIRFGIEMETDKFNALVSNGAYVDGYTVGALLLPADLTTSDVLEATTTVAQGVTIVNQTIEVSEWKESDTAGYMKAYVYLYNFPAGDYNREVLATGYIYNGSTYEYTYGYDEDNEKVTDTISRSMAYAASQHLVDNPTDSRAERYIRSYNVNFYGADGETEVEALKDVTAKYGTTVSAPEYSEEFFLGWYADKACTTEFDFTQAIKGTTNVYSKWTQTHSVTGTVTVGTDDKTVNVLAESDDYSAVLTGEVANGVASVEGELPNGEYTLRALGYQETATVTVADADNTFALTPATYEFGAFSLNGTTYTSAGYDVNNTPTDSTDETYVHTWYRGTSSYDEFIQARGIPHAIYYEGFAETEYAVGATVHTNTSLHTGSGVLGTEANAKTGGISISSGADSLHIVIVEKGFRMLLGDIDANGNAKNNIYFSSSTSPFNASTSSSAVSGGYNMLLTRKNNVLTVYVDGVKYISMDAENGIQLYNAFAEVTPTYDTNGNVGNNEALKKRLGDILDVNTPNAVGYIGFVHNGSGGKTFALFDDFYRSTKVDEAVSVYSRLPAVNMSTTVTLTNNSTATTWNSSNTAFRYGFDEEDRATAETNKLGWYYAVDTGTLYNYNEKWNGLKRSLLVGGVQSGDFEFTFTASFKQHQGVWFTDGVENNSIFIGNNANSSSSVRLCYGDCQEAQWPGGFGILDSTTWRIRRENGVISIYVNNATSGNVEKLAMKVDATGVYAYETFDTEPSATFTSTTAVAQKFMALLNKEIAVGFAFVNTPTAPSTTYSNVSIKAL